MRPANLLIDIVGLGNLQANVNANIALTNMFDAYEKAIDKEDKIFYHPEFWTFHGSWNSSFMEIILESYETARAYLPWLNPDNYHLLYSIPFSLSTTDEKSDSLESLDKEFREENNGHLCCTEIRHNHFVFDVTSWYELHCNYISNYPQWVDWKKNEVFTNTEYSDFCILEIVDKQNNPHTLNKKEHDKIKYFNTDLIRTFRNNKDALLDLATEIARRNAYIYDEKLSKSEKKRRQTRISAIFKIRKNGSFQYLSLDTENGQFEVCNKKGEHIGVYNFSGNQTGKADEKGGHDIVIK